ncbi:hypothetical protein [Planctomicrobium sp. SH527]|uniref:hypothetical protein n=1 Tax=Planctomicrobium sp. SH527 TaxID=3448123 RepID=UPI003F5ADED6
MGRQQIETRCDCGGILHPVDHRNQSATLACSACGRCYLKSNLPEFGELIPLRDFHLKRGDGPGQRPTNDMRMAQQLFECLVWDVWPSPATIADFGIDSSRHLTALQYAARSGITAYDLDRVLGDGPAITRLVRSVLDQSDRSVQFETLHDNVNWSDADDEAP